MGTYGGQPFEGVVDLKLIAIAIPYITIKTPQQ
jgi:hypothetical protein